MTRNIPAQQPTSEPPSKVQYAHEVVQQVACGIVRHQGFDSIESSALITLTEVMERCMFFSPSRCRTVLSGWLRIPCAALPSWLLAVDYEFVGIQRVAYNRRNRLC